MGYRGSAHPFLHPFNIDLSICLRVSEKLAAGNIRDEISRSLYATKTIALKLFIFVA